MARIKHHIEFVFAKFGFGIANFLSPKSAGSLGKFLGRFFSRLIPKRKRIALDKLKHAFKDTKSDDEYEKIVTEVFENIGQTFIELARFKNSSSQNLKSMVTCNNVSRFQKAFDENKGAIIVTSHFGNWEMASGWLVEHGFPTDVVVKVQSNPLIDSLINQYRKNTGVGIIPVKTSTLRDIIKALKHNHFIGIAADQHDPSGNLLLEFFGRKASIAKGPAVFAKKQNCPILPAVMRRVQYNKFEVIASQCIYPSDSMNDEDDIIRMTKDYLLFFEDVIRQYPGQWMWTHRRWKIKTTN